MRELGREVPDETPGLDGIELWLRRFVQRRSVVRETSGGVFTRFRALDPGFTEWARVRAVPRTVLIMRTRVLVVVAVLLIVVVVAAVVIVVVVVVAVAVVVVVVVVVHPVGDGHDRAATLVRVVIAVGRKMEVRKDLDSQEPECTRDQRKCAAMAAKSLHPPS